ncbi:MAG: methylmalonyl-CoA epimerase [Deltaproteobacteria bacterium]|nr:methylmalonyl-CoA epimerase [Deltaproteobacteria bacterium]
MKKLDHLGIAVKDLDEARTFWERALGIPCTHVEELPERGIRVAFLPIGDVRIELIAPMREGSEVSKFLETRGPGIHHVCFEAPAGQATVDALKACGTRMIDEKLKPGAHGAQVAFIHPKSTGGVLVEVAQLPGPGTHP